MKKRALDRVHTCIDARLFHNHAFCSGTFLNLSEKGVFISAKKYFPVDATFVTIMRVGNEQLLVIPTVKWIKKINGMHHYLGAEILNPQKDYIRFVENLRLNGNKP